MQWIRNHKTLIGVGTVLIAGWITVSYAAERSVEIYATPEYKSDTARMVEAYERLSTQYLSLVQQNLSQMNQTDQQILTKLAEIEKKIDLLTEKVDALKPEGPTPPKPLKPASD
jgi:transcription initiation factor IIF auxiliary subunit